MDLLNTGEDPNIEKKCDSNPSSPMKESKRTKISGAQDHFNEVDKGDSDCPKPTSNSNVIAHACDDEQKKNTTKVEQIALNCEKDPSRIPDSKKKGMLDNQSDVKEGEGSNCSSLGDFFSMGRCRKALYTMIILQKLPFRLVESNLFQTFSHSIQPGFIMPSSRTVVKECKELCLEEKEKLKRMLVEKEGRVCLAMEVWTTIHKENVNYVVLTVQFIDDNWKLH